MRKIYNSEMPHPTHKEFGNLIKEKRKKLEMSQQDVADKLGVTAQQYQKYEYGSNRITLQNAFKIADVLSISYKEFKRAYDLGEGKANGK